MAARAAAIAYGASITCCGANARPRDASASRTSAPPARTIVALDHPVDHRELAVADICEIIGDAHRGDAVVEADARVLSRRIERPRQHVRHLHVGEQTEQLAGVLGPDQDYAVDTAFDQRARDLHFLLEIEVVTGQQQQIAAFVERFLQCVRGLRVKQVVERRQHGAHGPAAPGANALAAPWVK